MASMMEAIDFINVFLIELISMEKKTCDEHFGWRTVTDAIHPEAQFDLFSRNCIQSIRFQLN